MTIALTATDNHGNVTPTAAPPGSATSPGVLVHEVAAPAAVEAKGAVPDAAAMLALHAALHSAEDFERGSAAMATALARLLGAERVSMGMVKGGYAELQAVSGTLDFDRRGEFARLAGAAMDEAIEQAAVVAFPGTGADRPRVTLAQQALARHGAGAAQSVPLVAAGRCIGALCIETREALATGQARWCEDMACIIAPTLALKQQASLGWAARLAQAWREAPVRRGKGARALMLAGAIMVLGLSAVLFAWPLEYRVSAPARLEGIVQRALVAPADGYLQVVHVKPGDIVKADQVLAELAEQELDLQRRKSSAELAQHENSARAALARGERTQYVISQGKAAEARAQLELVEQQLARGRIRAPFDGVVIKGDLSQMLGAPVQRGDVLLTVAPGQGFRLIVEVDERDIADVRVGARGAVALAAAPGDTATFRVVRVTPVATNRDGRNFYEVEARLGDVGTALRPGLLGVGKIETGDRTLAWIWGHRALDWLRLTLWSLGG